MTSLNPTLAWWRRFLKVINSKFQGDAQNLNTVRYAFKMETMSNKDVNDPEQLAKLLLDGETAREWFITDMIRGDLANEEKGNYKLQIKPEHYDSYPIKPVWNPDYFYFEVPEHLVAKEYK